MHFGMANRAVLVSWTAQIVESWRNATQSIVLRADIRMAFKAHIANFVPRQQLRISGAMRYMTRRATFQAHRSVFERKRPALIAMAVCTSLVARHRFAMRIMAIDTGHSALGNLVPVRLLKFRLLSYVALRAEVINGRCGTDAGPLFVDRVAGHTTHLTLAVTTLNSAAVSRFI